MLLGKILFFLLFLHLVDLQIRINLHLTDWENEDDDIQHDCLYAAANIETESDPYQIISYCMSEWPSKFNIKENNFDRKLTFSQLSEQKITSEQLYHWSAPMDLIEEYQLYLNQHSHSDQTSLATQIFYNCTLPYFGLKCEYILNKYNANYSSLNEMISDYYNNNIYEPTLFTCYIHLECNRGPYPSCLDWTEICDGKIDCIDNGLDEEHCWQLEIHQCNANEYRCTYGQCIPKAFFRDDMHTPDCLDKSDEMIFENDLNLKPFLIREPIFMYEDITCTWTNNIPPYSRRFLTSSCVRNRENLLLQAMFSIKPNSTTEECWTALKCIIHMPISSEQICSRLCDNEICEKIIQKECPDIIYMPAYPILLGHVYLVYNKSKLQYTDRSLEPTYVCYDDQRLYVPDDDNNVLLSNNNNTCRLYKDSSVDGADTFETKWLQLYVSPIQRWLHRITPLIYNNSVFCDRSIMYQCMNSSKCISKDRLFDLVIDCYYIDDEHGSIPLNNIDLMKQLRNSFRCPTTDRYIPWYTVDDKKCDCTISGDHYCADENSDEFYFRKKISFQTICDGFPHLALEFTEDKNGTDETNCEQWPLIHIYNRCDGFWHFLNGSDEINCDSSLALLNCSENHHVCLSSKTKKLICLPIEKANDGIIDCIGAADEPTLCQRNLPDQSYPEIFLCENDTSSRPCITGDYLCDGNVDCAHKEDEQVCKNNDLIKSTVYKGICTQNYELEGSDVARILCRLFVNSGRRSKIYFTFDQSQNSMGQYFEHGVIAIPFDDPILPDKSYQQRCHRGLDLQVYFDKQKNLTTNLCLCPSNYYGTICQYQNQRISLTLQFSITSNLIRIPFLILISLIDDSYERIIHSYQQLTYLFIKNCSRKFNFYLLYSNRPKNALKNYSIQIDFYEKIKLKYRGSIIKAINYSFLPVHHLAFQLNIPNTIETCFDHQCIHGKCRKYFDDPNNKTFCQCHSGWSGKSCTIKYICSCSSQSLCIGQLANNRSLCICPLNKMGPRCLIDNIIRQNKRCINGGQCILADEYEISKNKFLCICPKGYSGDRCEIARTKLIASFDKNLNIPSSIFIHFIEIKINNFPVRTTIFKRIPIRQDSIIIYWSLPFHIVFIELTNKNYYLFHMQKLSKQSSVIENMLNSSNQCLHINEFFNETIRNYSLLHRIKYYHFPCQTNFSLLCFYDEQQFCLCQQRLTNCFNFEHNSSLNCSGKSDCENGGECFQENSRCPKYFLCQCPVCFYGTRCQLNTNGFSLSLDAILGYHIQSNRNIFKQSRAILISSILSTIVIIGGFMNGILSLITFKNKNTRQSGCGIYLLCSSIITLLTMLIFTFKYWILIISHIGSIKNESFLKIQCILVDYFLRICLTMDQWLTAFVSIERAFTIIKGVNINKKKMKLVAKWTIVCLLLITILTNIHDPIHRDLSEENDDDDIRFWCIVDYSSTIRIINYIINIFHFIVPFIINIISAIIIIIIKTRQRSAIQTKQNYREIMKEQLQEHKNLLIGLCVLIILGIPRLIILFASGCMKTANDSWLFLIGYFISLIPPTLTFILFVLPSTVYKQEFRQAINQYRKILKRN